MLDWVFLLVGLGLILVGANILTDGSAAIARRFGLSDLVVGLTVVALGTSAPEFAISVISAISGNAGLAIGNVVGSNIFNILMIIGVTALVRPISVERTVMTTEIPLVVLSSVVLLIMGMAPELDGTANIVTRVDGLLLLIFFLIFMRYTFSQAKNGQASEEEPGGEKKEMPVLKSVIFIVLGLAGLIYGGDRFVAGASGIARAFGVSDAVIGLTIVAMGTSLPELAASVTAAIKGRPGMAVGNVIGSNIFNIFFVLGSAATIRQLPFGDIGSVDLLTLVGASLLFWAFGWLFGTRVIKRIEGAFMVVCYVGYTLWLVLTA